ncbi:Na+/H+ antiporter NhaA [Granulosicoccaceae sp. 1_MG-2023]|nr:Na+/H+ antiporter NhaA [Granulosicoccaceae sp. 1_MG-2023]
MNGVQDKGSSVFYHPAAGGVLLVLASVVAILMANSPLSHYYDLLVETPVSVQVGALEIAKPLLLWVNDGLMAVFFLLVGLELKHEFLEGELSDRRQIILPAVGAIGGMAVPALVYVLFNYDNPAAIKGWAIPAATDIAFVLGILALLGPRVPVSLKIFLTSLAIFDDIGAIIIIALFYTSKISLFALTVVALCIVMLFLIRRAGVLRMEPYLMVGVVMWVATLKSGVHATLAGVVLAMFIPAEPRHDGRSSLHELERSLRDMVELVILPIFAFCNAGVSVIGMGMAQLVHPVTMGITAGLFIGKQVGVFAFCWLAIRYGWASLPRGINWINLYGGALLCGIGFTMSLFIGSLAFEQSTVNQVFDERLGIILGSLLSGVLGYVVLRLTLKAPASPAGAEQSAG